MNDRDHDRAMAEYALHYAVQNIIDLSKEHDGYKLNRKDIMSDALLLLTFCNDERISHGNSAPHRYRV